MLYIEQQLLTKQGMCAKAPQTITPTVHHLGYIASCGTEVVATCASCGHGYSSCVCVVYYGARVRAYIGVPPPPLHTPTPCYTHTHTPACSARSSRGGLACVVEERGGCGGSCLHGLYSIVIRSSQVNVKTFCKARFVNMGKMCYFNCLSGSSV